jgi:predicted nucleic acid-binding protein
MLPSPFRAILDANVLFPYSLRDTLLRAAHANLYQMYWSDQILEEARRNLVRTGTTTAEQAERLIETMKSVFPEALVTRYEPFIAAMKNDVDDRHVAAAAVKAGAQVIVTSNLKHFRMLPESIVAQSPDEFLCNLFDLDPDGLLSIVHKQAAAMKKPPRSVDQLLAGLAKLVPEFAEAVRRQMHR